MLGSLVVFTELHTGERLYWSNAHGWGDLQSADRFTEDEGRTLRLPVGGCWGYAPHAPRCECTSPDCAHEREPDEAGQRRGDPEAFRCRLAARERVPSSPDGSRTWWVTARLAVDLQEPGATREAAIENAEAMIADCGLSEFVDEGEAYPDGRDRLVWLCSGCIERRKRGGA